MTVGPWLRGIDAPHYLAASPRRSISALSSTKVSRRHVPAEHCLLQVGVAFERHMVQRDLCVLRELLHQQVWRRTDAGRAVVDLAWILARRFDVVVERLVRRVCAHREPERVTRQPDDEGEVID